jgi:hypothetical protein
MVKQLFNTMARIRGPVPVRNMCFDIMTTLSKDKGCATAGVHAAQQAYAECQLRPVQEVHSALRTGATVPQAVVELWPDCRGPRVSTAATETDAKFFDMMRELAEQVKWRM